MVVFNYLINFIEGFILSSFIAFYFDLKDKIKYISIVSLICFSLISISNFINEFDHFLLYILIIALLISLWITKKDKNFEDIIICFIAGMMLLIANLISLSCTSLIFNISTTDIYDNQQLFVFAIILSKLIFTFIAIITCAFKLKTNTKLPMKYWWIILILGLSIIFVLAILIESLLSNFMSSNMILILMIAIIVISFLFLVIFRKIQIENAEKIKLALEIQKNKYNTENYNKIVAISNQITEAEHRMMYVLMQLRTCIDNMDYENASIITDQYIKKVKSFNSMITTNNPYFDFIISRKINELIFQDIYVKKTIFISQNDIYNNKNFCDLILKIIYIFEINLDNSKELNLGISQESNFVLIEVIGRLTTNNFKISDEINNLIKLFNADFTLNNTKEIVTLKLIIEI
ncbi:MAG: hypothetical protein UFX20_15110 [Longibaculum muris]|uniref:GHKL domain-containing protein n=2 Tax=Bacillota TaxID=1239 RepID=A0A4R3YHU3_9FIRM|nr:hypothetical protein [Longibaculum muris]KXU45906.1 hypothetical protein HMPREF3037_02194 [Candidatus Stoquefichus sp. KLE1796]MBS5369063.1 hypothetical protein [Coprobacillus cateniformis]MCR1889222.1 hypothetical protein [Longibaculum muris]MED9813420.1 hypothetical protein [Longibaculum muris]TCV91740.1 hypothetical protein EDD60_1297 [Longibaculum muris]